MLDIVVPPITPWLFLSHLELELYHGYHAVDVYSFMLPIHCFECVLNNLGEIVSPCLTPLLSFFFLCRGMSVNCHCDVFKNLMFEYL